MVGTTLTKAILIIICINILLYVGGVRVVNTDTSTQFMGNFIDTSTNQSLSSNFTDIGEGMTDFSQSGVLSEGLSFIDALRMVISFLSFIVNIIFTPFGLFIAGGLPPIVGLIVGLPLTVILVLGVAYFIRGGN